MRAHLVWLTAFACGRSPEIMSESPEKRLPPPPAIDAASSVVPSVNLEPGFEPLAFAPGRYAVLTERRQRGVHARDQLSLWSSASLVLDLSDDGGATACLGQAFEHSVSGAHDRLESFRVQQGFRGRHAVRDGEAMVELTADDTVCPAVRVQRAPARLEGITLRCVRAKAREHAALREPVLLCEWQDIDQVTYSGLAGDGVAPGRWILLGGGHGATVAVTGRLPSTDGADVKAVVAAAAQRLEASAWDRRAPATGSDLEP